MKRLVFTSVLIAFCAFFAQPSLADSSCSVRDVTGNWMFATSIGRQMLGEPFPPEPFTLGWEGSSSWPDPAWWE